MRPAAYWLASGILAAALATGCGRKSAETQKSGDGHKHAEGGKTEEHKEGDGHKHGKEEQADEHGAEEKAGVVFKEGRGLQLSPEIIKALGLTTVEAVDRPVTAVANIAAQVFTTKPQVLATASMSKEEAERLEKQSFTGAKITRIDRTAASATRMVEVIFAVERTPVPEIGDFVTLTLASEAKSMLAVPRSAILDAATGTYVYVLNGEFYLRTAVKLGARSADHVEITDGLYSGDMVVVSPVDQLWLSELRLTKGGGHSH
jgi:multidrug efflux pump subunit AcrA (membrane-fusion protein)